MSDVAPIALLSAAFAALWAGADRRWAWAPVAAGLAAIVSFGLGWLASTSPLALGPGAPWLALGSSTLGAWRGSKSGVLPSIAVSALFLPLWAGFPFAAVVILLLAAWLQFRLPESEYRHEASPAPLLLVMLVLVCAAPLAVRTTFGPLPALAPWSWAVALVWWLTVRPDWRFRHFWRGALLVAGLTAMVLGPALLPPGGALFALLSSILMTEASCERRMPGWWFLVIPGLMYAGLFATATYYDLLLVLPMLALCTRLLRLPARDLPTPQADTIGQLKSDRP